MLLDFNLKISSKLQLYIYQSYHKQPHYWSINFMVQIDFQLEICSFKRLYFKTYSLKIFILQQEYFHIYYQSFLSFLLSYFLKYSMYKLSICTLKLCYYSEIAMVLIFPSFDSFFSNMALELQNISIKSSFFLLHGVIIVFQLGITTASPTQMKIIVTLFLKTDICTCQRGLLFKWQCSIFFQHKPKKEKKYGKHKENRGIKQAEKFKVRETSDSSVTIKQILSANFNKSITKLKVKVIIFSKAKAIYKNMELLIQIWTYISKCCLLLADNLSPLLSCQG